MSAGLEAFLLGALGIGCLGLSFGCCFIAIDALDNGNRLGGAVYFVFAVVGFVIGVFLWRTW